jgi:tetratricopeptide (TPR) repeat protein
LNRLAGDALYPAIVRATALSLLGSYPGAGALSAFERALQDEDPLIRHTAVGGLTVADPEALRELLAPLLADPARAVRQEAAVRLAGVPREAFEGYQAVALDSALEEYRRSMAYSLDFAASAYNLGNLSVAEGDAEEAERYYRLAIDIDDLFYPAKSNFALLLNAQGRNEEAARLLREVVEAYPEQYEAAYSLGLLLGEMGDYEGAAEVLAMAAEGLPERPRISYNLGQILAFLGRPEEAEAAYRRVLATTPGDLDALVALAQSCFLRSDFEAVLEIAGQVEAADPQSPLAAQLRAAAEEGLRRSRP